MLEKSTAINEIKANDIMTVTPKTIGPDELAVDALDKLRTNGITQLAVVENTGTNDSVGQGKYLGIIHLHDLIREGLI